MIASEACILGNCVGSGMVACRSTKCECLCHERSSRQESNDNERKTMSTYTDCPDSEVITISSAISDAFGEASHLRHEVVDALDRSLAAEVQKHLAAARRALDAYVDASQIVDVHALAVALSDDGDVDGLVALREARGSKTDDDVERDEIPGPLRGAHDGEITGRST